MPELISVYSTATAAVCDSPLAGRLENVRAVLESCGGLPRSDTQREFHDCMLGAVAQLMFTDDLEEELNRLLQELGIEEVPGEIEHELAMNTRYYGRGRPLPRPIYSQMCLARAMAHVELEQQGTEGD